MILLLIGEQLVPILLGPGSVLGPVLWGIAGVTAALGVLFGTGVFGGVSGSTLSAIQKIRDQVSSAVDITKRFSWTVARMAGALLVALGNVLENLIKPILQALKNIKKALEDLKRIITDPHLNALQKIRAVLENIYFNWLRPLIVTIQNIRKILTLLRAFGVKWAGDLDARLARIEGKISGPYIWLLQQLNRYGSWINIILTTRATIQKIIFKRSLLENMGTLSALFFNTHTDTSSAGAPIPAGQGFQPKNLQQCQADMTLYVQANVGPIAAIASNAQILFVAGGFNA
jgi:hypothetical protein